MGIDRPGGTDTRSENVEKPQATDSPPAPPPDRPGSPGQPSRLESLRAAREAQEAQRAELGTQETGDEQDDEREKEAAESSSADPTGEQQNTQADPKDTEKPPEIGETEPEDAAKTGETRRDGSGEEPRRSDLGDPASETSTEPRGDDEDERTERSPAEPTADKADAPADPQTTEDNSGTIEADPADGAGDEHRTQNAGETVPPSPAESAHPEAREPDAEDAQGQDRPPLPQQDGQAPETDGADTGQEPAAEQPAQAADEPAASTDQQDGRTDTQEPAEGQNRPAEGPQESDGQEIRLAWPPPGEEGVTRWSSQVVQVNERTPGNQLENRDRNAQEQPETPATTDDESNKYRDLPDVPRDGTPGRGELIPPEDDPADQNPFEPDPERGQRNRWENYDRVNTAFGATKKIIKGVQDLQAKPSPTGQAESRADANTHRPDVHAGNSADIVGSGLILAAAATSMLLQTYRNLRSSRRSGHAHN